MIRPFRALRYSPAAGPVQRLVSQPYDKITEESKVHYFAQSEWNVARLIRGESGPDDETWHPRTASAVADWRRRGILVRDEEPAYFVYRQEFRDAEGRLRQRTGITGLFDLGHRGEVRHHERTHGRARSDRRRLLDATGIHFGQVFLLRSSGPALPESDLALATEPVEAIEACGTRHEFSRLRDPAAAARLEAIFAASGYVIADGHHRFTVASEYADAEARPAAAKVLVTVVDVDDPGLVILPTHRVLAGLPGLRTRGIMPFFQAVGAEPVALLADEAPFVQRLREAGQGTIGVVSRGGAFLWRLDLRGREGIDALDAQRLEEDVIRPLLRDLEVEEHLRYHRDPMAAIREARQGGADLAFLLNPVNPRQVTDIANAGGVMPQKTTDFFPKMLTGFAFYDTRDP